MIKYLTRRKVRKGIKNLERDYHNQKIHNRSKLKSDVVLGSLVGSGLNAARVNRALNKRNAALGLDINDPELIKERKQRLGKAAAIGGLIGAGTMPAGRKAATEIPMKLKLRKEKKWLKELGGK